MLEIAKHSFNDILRKRNLDVGTLAKRAELEQSKLEKIALSGGELSEPEVEALAAQLAVPIASFFVSQPFEGATLVDYRLGKSTILKPDRSVLSVLSYLENLSSTLVAINANVQLKDIAFEHEGEFSTKRANELGKKWRQNWAFPISEQLENKNSNFVYKRLREFVESLGAYVLHHTIDDRSLSGLYTKIDHGPHFIVINTKFSNSARRAFTLAHEFCHLLTRNEGISNVSSASNRVEKFCNKFAAVLLAPSKLIRMAIEFYGGFANSSPDFIKKIANFVGISQEATFLRLVELKFLDRDDYRNWKKSFPNSIPIGDIESFGRSKEYNVAKRKLGKFGSSLLVALHNGLVEEELDEIDIFRLVRVKPKDQSEVFKLAEVASA